MQREITNLRLQAVLCHQGDTCNAGHYVTFARHESTWICYNDGDEPKELKKTPSAVHCTSCLVLYECVNTFGDSLKP